MQYVNTAAKLMISSRAVVTLSRPRPAHVSNYNSACGRLLTSSEARCEEPAPNQAKPQAADGELRRRLALSAVGQKDCLSAEEELLLSTRRPRRGAREWLLRRAEVELARGAARLALGPTRAEWEQKSHWKPARARREGPARGPAAPDDDDDGDASGSHGGASFRPSAADMDVNKPRSHTQAHTK